MTTTTNIYERLSAISTELATVAKNLEVQVSQNNKYKAVGEADVLRAVKPLEAKYRVFSYPVNREIIESGTLETQSGNMVRKQFFLRVKATYRFINIDKPEEYVDIISYGDGIDSGDKATGKALTYADKYALLKAYKIVTGDDPDQEASQELLSADTKKVVSGKTTRKIEVGSVDTLIKNLTYEQALTIKIPSGKTFKELKKENLEWFLNPENRVAPLHKRAAELVYEHDFVYPEMAEQQEKADKEADDDIGDVPF